MGEEPRGFTYGVSFTGYQERVASCNEGYTILFFNEGKVFVMLAKKGKGVNTSKGQSLFFVQSISNLLKAKRGLHPSVEEGTTPFLTMYVLF